MFWLFWGGVGAPVGGGPPPLQAKDGTRRDYNGPGGALRLAVLVAEYLIEYSAVEASNAMEGQGKKLVKAQLNKDNVRKLAEDPSFSRGARGRLKQPVCPGQPPCWRGPAQPGPGARGPGPRPGARGPGPVARGRGSTIRFVLKCWLKTFNGN